MLNTTVELIQRPDLRQPREFCRLRDGNGENVKTRQGEEGGTAAGSLRLIAG
jgi:hypothetical protein